MRFRLSFSHKAAALGNDEHTYSGSEDKRDLNDRCMPGAWLEQN